jgi:uncharacterized membrane protein
VPPPRRGEVRQFVVKALIVIGLIAGITALSAGLLASKFQQLAGSVERMVENTQAKMQQYTQVGGASFWEKMEHELDRAADPASDLPAESP